MNRVFTPKNIILALQHLIAMFGATVLVPMLTGFNPAVALFAAGAGTLIFHFCTKKVVPVFLGSSFAFIPVILTVKTMYDGDLAYAQGGLVVAGLIYVLLSLVIGKIKIETLNKILPSYVIGPMIIIIGLNLLPVAIDMTQGNYLLAAITLTTLVLVNVFAKGFTKQLAILIAVVVGYISALLLGTIDVTTIINAKYVIIPEFTLPKFSIPAILTIIPVVLAVFMEHVGDITTNGAVVGKDFVKDPGLNRTLLGDGLATVFSAFIGGPANTTYGENTSVLAMTKNYNPAVLRLAAIFAIMLALVGKVGAAISTIPVSVMGGISLVLFSMIAWIGVSTLRNSKTKINIKAVIVISTMLLIGLGTSYLSKYAGINLGIRITEEVMFTGLSLAAVTGVVLNLILSIFIKDEITS